MITDRKELKMVALQVAQEDSVTYFRCSLEVVKSLLVLEREKQN